MRLSRTRTAFLAAACGLALAGASNAEELSYGYLRTVDGPGRVVQSASAAAVEAEANYPLLPGDRVATDGSGLIEASLPDFNVVRLAGDSELVLQRLALSADSEDDRTVLQLDRGEIQLLIKDLLPVAERPRVDTANVTVYLQASGVYRIASDGYGWTEVVVRRGFAELATERGSSVVRTGERAWIDGARAPRAGIDRAAGFSALEHWGAGLDSQLDTDLAAWRDSQPAGYDEPLVEEHLTYAAAPLARHGNWVEIDDGWAWRPRVTVGWRPYTAGWWVDSPSGLVWVSDEPWAWVTYHYGSWVPSPAFGWVWRPGRHFAPAWVYWHWGSTHVAWVPVGYYTGFYGRHRPYGRGFRFGIYGWAGGGWSYYSDWSFCDRRSLRRRDLRHHSRRGSDWARGGRHSGPGRGLLTTDSRPETLRRAVPRSAGVTRSGGSDRLPDVTPFVSRQRELPREVAERVFTTRQAMPAGRRDDGWEAPARSSRESARSAAVVERAPADSWRGPTARVRPQTRTERHSPEAPAERSLPTRSTAAVPRYQPAEGTAERSPERERARAPQVSPRERSGGVEPPAARTTVRRALPTPRERYSPPPPRYVPPADRAAPPAAVTRAATPRAAAPRTVDPRSPAPRSFAPRATAPNPSSAPRANRSSVARRVVESIRSQYRGRLPSARQAPPQSAAPSPSARPAPRSEAPRPSARPASPPSSARPSANAPPPSSSRPSARGSSRSGRSSSAARSNRSSDRSSRSSSRGRASRRPPNG